MNTLVIENLTFAYTKGKKKIFENFNYSFSQDKIYVVTGKSGAGKTTLLSLLSALTAPTDGKISLEGQDISKIDAYKYRSNDVGIVFQSYNLLPKLTAVENVVLSMDISEKEISNKKELALELLEKMGLNKEEADRPILQLSGGQQQRVALARALSYSPKIILADEPTGNLDGETQNDIMKLFQKLAHEEGKCVIIVTHSPQVSKMADEQIKIS